MSSRIFQLAAGLLLACSGWVLPGTAEASMALNRAIVHFLQGEPARQDIIVRNPDPQPLYVKLEVSEIINPGKADETRRAIREAEEMDLLVTPNKMVIQPGQSKVVRLVNLKPKSEVERVYRVKFVPVAAQELAEATNDASFKIKVLIAYDVLVLAAPAKPLVDVEATRSGRQLTLRNKGNVYSYIQNGRQCPTPDSAESECADVRGTRLYPGATWSVELPFDQPVEFDFESLLKYERRQIP